MGKQQKDKINQNNAKIDQNIKDLMTNGSSRDKNQIKSYMQHKDDHEMRVFTGSAIHRRLFKPEM
jgi:hypothetical protein